jgi:hypothetical protein
MTKFANPKVRYDFSLPVMQSVCAYLQRIAKDKLNSQMRPYRSGPSKTWIKIKKRKAPAATRAADGTF